MSCDILMAMELDQVEAFVAIVRRGGFSHAAATLHLSQPAISRRLKLLETELGAPLFERIRTGVLLTDAGREFLPHAEGVLASMRDGLEAVKALQGVAGGAVSLAIVGTLASSPLTRVLRRFREAHPAVDLRIRTALSAEVSELVRGGEVTLGLRYDEGAHRDILATKVHDEPMVAVCSAQHRLARARSVDPKALIKERWLAFPPRLEEGRRGRPEPYARVFESRLAAAGLGGAEIVPIDSLTAQKRMVEAGFGLALLPESSAEEELRAGSLRALRVRGMRATIPIYLVHRRRAYQTGATRALKAMLLAWAAPHSGKLRTAPAVPRA